MAQNSGRGSGGFRGIAAGQIDVGDPSAGIKSARKFRVLYDTLVKSVFFQ
jgi:hypothetical protein